MSADPGVPLLQRARARAGAALFAMVAGPDGPQARERIHGTPGPRWFEAGSPVQVVHGDASMFVGGLRALLLQSLHPSAMAAVADHSGYRGDPWGRLARTSTFLATTTFATAEDSQRAVDVVRSVHSRIRGHRPDGVPYAADDPHLLRWVHVAEVDSFLRAHQVYGARALDRAEADTYVAQAGRVATALGAVDVPGTVAELQAAIEAYRPGLRASDAAMQAAEFILRRPPVPPWVRPAYGLLVSAAVDLLPGWAVDELGLRTPGPARRVAARTAGEVGTRGIRWILGAQEDVATEDGVPTAA